MSKTKGKGRSTKKKKRKETEEQAPIRYYTDYREALFELLADMKAIGKFCVTLQVFKW